jgi:hypothetical protein
MWKIHYKSGGPTGKPSWGDVATEEAALKIACDVWNTTGDRIDRIEGPGKIYNRDQIDQECGRRKKAGI